MLAWRRRGKRQWVCNVINVIIAILIAMSTDSACQLGTPVDWYEWADVEGDTAELVMTLETDKSGDVWVYQEADGDYLVFVFREDIDSVLASGRSDPHGKCAVRIEGE